MLYGTYRVSGILPGEEKRVGVVKAERDMQTKSRAASKYGNLLRGEEEEQSFQETYKIAELLRATQDTAFGGMRTQAH